MTVPRTKSLKGFLEETNYTLNVCGTNSYLQNSAVDKQEFETKIQSMYIKILYGINGKTERDKTN